MQLRQTYRHGVTARMTTTREQMATVSVGSGMERAGGGLGEGARGEPEEFPGRPEQQQETAA